MRNYSDIELLGMLTGSRKNHAFEEIYRRYSHLVYGVCLKYLNSRDDSLDSVIEVFEVLMQKLPQQSITNFSSWLHSVTKNHCLMKLRKAKSQNLAFNQFQNFQQELIEPETNDIEVAAYQKMETAIEQLPLEQKTCILLFYYSRKSYSEIADETGYPVKQVKSYLQNGRIKLKKLIKN